MIELDLVTHWDALYPLFEAHYKETETKEEAFDPDKDAFLHLHKIGMLKVYCHLEDNKPAAYYVVSITPSLHVKGVVQAKEEAIYVLPEYRNKGVASAMEAALVAKLQEMGVDYLYTTYKKGTTIPERNGMQLIEYGYERKL